MLDLRDAYALPRPDAVELRAFTHGLMPTTVPAMLQHFADDWRTRGVDAWNDVPNHWLPNDPTPVGWWSLPTYLGDRFIAPALGASAGTCIMQPHVHWTVQCLLSADEVFAGRDEIVVSATAFPSVLHSVQQWAALRKATVTVVPADPSGFLDREAFLAAVGPGTALAVLSHVGFTTGELLTNHYLRRVADRVHDAGGLFVVDGYHATGSVPVDVEAIGADVYMGGLLKEASGSAGNAYVYLHPRVDLTPRLTGWFGDADPFGFAPQPRAHDEVRRRFLGGTTAVATLYHAVEGLRLLLDAGLEEVRADSLAKTARCLEHIDAAGLPLRSPRADDRRGAMVILKVPHADRLCAYLKAYHIYTDSRQGRYLRLAPFVWNTLDEIDRTFDTISEALHSGRYKESMPPSSSGPVT